MIEIRTATTVLAALAHDARLRAFRDLVRAGPAGLSAGAVAGSLGLGATAVSFHLNRLLQAGLVDRRRDGARLIYSANFDLIRQLRAFLDSECCADSTVDCGPACKGAGATGRPAARAHSEQQEV